MANNNTQFLLECEAIELLNSYGICYPAYQVVNNAYSIEKAASELGFPLVMKVLSKKILHKSDFGGVLVNIQTAEQAKLAYSTIIANAAEHGVDGVDTVLLCKQAAQGIELIVGGLKDEIFGAVLMLGMGGVFVELLKDVSFRVCPVSLSEARNMISELNAYPLLMGMRSQEKTDIDALARLIVSVSKLMLGEQQIREIDLNPVRLYSKGAICLDARIGIN